MIETEERRFPAVDGGRNFRDLGGYPTEDGRHTRWGLIYRSGTFSGCTEAGQAVLKALGLRTMIDLRTTDERAALPVDWFGDDERTYWSRDYETGFGELRNMLGSGSGSGAATAEAARESMMVGYRRMVAQQVPAYRELFARLLAEEVPLAVNCSAGKDRAGMASAFILTALGVPREMVVADYLMTNKVYEGEQGRFFSSSPLMAAIPSGVMEAIRTCHVDYIDAALGEAEATHGSVEGYFAAELGVGPDELAMLRERYTE